MATKAVTPEELNRALADIAELRAEFITADGERGTGSMTDAEIDAFQDRMDQMRDEHVLISTMGLLDALHARLSGNENDFVTMVKCLFITMSARSIDGIPAEAHRAAWDWIDDPETLDLSYLDEEGGA